jgi:hypothetical protein
VRLSTGKGHLVNSQFLNRELCVFVTPETGQNFILWFLYRVDVVFHQYPGDVISGSLVGRCAL